MQSVSDMEVIASAAYAHGLAKFAAAQNELHPTTIPDSLEYLDLAVDFRPKMKVFVTRSLTNVCTVVGRHRDLQGAKSDAVDRNTVPSPAAADGENEQIMTPSSEPEDTRLFETCDKSEEREKLGGEVKCVVIDNELAEHNVSAAAVSVVLDRQNDAIIVNGNDCKCKRSTRSIWKRTKRFFLLLCCCCPRLPR